MTKLLLRSLDGNCMLSYKHLKNPVNEFKIFLYKQFLDKKIDGINIPEPHLQHLVYKGQILEKGSLEEYGIKSGDSIVVIDAAPEPEDPIILQDPVPTKDIIEAEIIKYAKMHKIDSMLHSSRRMRMNRENQTSLSELASSQLTRLLLSSIGDNLDAPLTRPLSMTPPPFHIMQNTERDMEVEVNEEMLENLISMGFSEQRSRDALLRTHNDLELSLNYILEYRNEDNEETQSNLSIINSGHLRSGSNIDSVGEDNDRLNHIRQLTDMGFNENQAIMALNSNNGNVQSAINSLIHNEHLPSTILPNNNSNSTNTSANVVEANASIQTQTDISDLNTNPNNSFAVFTNPSYDINHNSTNTPDDIYNTITAGSSFDSENGIINRDYIGNLLDSDLIHNSLDHDDLLEYRNYLLDSLGEAAQLSESDFTPTTDTLNHELRQRLNNVLEELLQNVLNQQEQGPGPSGEFSE